MKIVFVGDFMPGGILSSNIQQYKNTFLSDSVRKALLADIIFCNLECPLIKAAPPLAPKILLHANKNTINLLKRANFNIVSLANNHTMDFGNKSLLQTMELLRKNNIKYVGAGKDLNEARKPAIFTKNNLNISFLAYGAPETWSGWPGRKNEHIKIWFANKNKCGVAPFNLNYIKEDIARIRNFSDFIIISVHWGDEYTCLPNPEIVSNAHKIIDFGANLIIGHHPHRLQGYENYHNGLIMYSLSNFLFSPYFDNKNMVKIHHKSRVGVILQCNVAKNKILSYKLIPTFQKKNEPIVALPSINKKNKILKKIKFLSSCFKLDYRKKYYNLKIKENKFRYIKSILFMIETRGLFFCFKRYLNKILKCNVLSK